MLDLSLLNSPTGIANGTNPRAVIDLPLTGSLDGGGLGVGEFRRASIAKYFDNVNVMQEAAIDEPRFTGNGLLLEGAGSNVCLQSREFETSPWTKAQYPILTKDQVGIDGVANSAWSMEDNHVSQFETIQQDIAIPAIR